MTQFVYGKNVVAQLLDDGRKIHEVWLMQGFRDQKLVRRVQEARIPVKWVNRAQLDAKVKTNRHQGVAACIDAYRTYSVDEILEAIPEGKNGLIIMLDELEDPHNLGAILRSADAVGADGIIIAYALNDVRKLNTKIPVVSMSPYPGQYELRVDLKYAFELAVTHFRRHGHRKIGFVCPDLSVVPLQWEGYLAAIGASGAYKLEVTGNPKFSRELDTMIQKEGVRAWCVTNDLLAARLMRHLFSSGYRVPEDAALIGFDGSAFVEVTPSPLTTVVFPAARIAERSIGLLFEKIESGETAFRPEPELVKPELFIGESCGCRSGKPYRISWDRQILTLDDGIGEKKELH